MGEPAQIYLRIAEISKEVTAITKSKENKQQAYMFRGIDDVYNALQPLLAKHGVFTVPLVLEERSEDRKTKTGGTLIYRILKVEYRAYAPDGSYVSGVVMGEGMDSGDKGSNKAMAVAHKYFILQLFCVPTEDMKDPEADNHDLGDNITEEQANEIKDLLAKTKANFHKFLEYMRVLTIESIPSEDYEKAKSALEAKLKNQQPVREPGEEG